VLIIVDHANDATKAKKKFESTRDLRVVRTFAVTSHCGIAPAHHAGQAKRKGSAKVGLPVFPLYLSGISGGRRSSRSVAGATFYQPNVEIA
jgi:hypothetical protein